MAKWHNEEFENIVTCKCGQILNACTFEGNGKYKERRKCPQCKKYVRIIIESGHEPKVIREPP